MEASVHRVENDCWASAGYRKEVNSAGPYWDCSEAPSRYDDDQVEEGPYANGSFAAGQGSEAFQISNRSPFCVANEF